MQEEQVMVKTDHDSRPKVNVKEIAITNDTKLDPLNGCFKTEKQKLERYNV